MVHSGNLTIVPDDRDRIPRCFGNSAAISGVALPANAVACLEVLRFGDIHCAPLIAWSVADLLNRPIGPNPFGKFDRGPDTSRVLEGKRELEKSEQRPRLGGE